MGDLLKQILAKLADRGTKNRKPDVKPIKMSDERAGSRTYESCLSVSSQMSGCHFSNVGYATRRMRIHANIK